ncbi:MAG: hypothetical protein GXP01_01705 [Alphaproteobacteria bacterium]|nr:hypothetical protein [Alphaproteobacteria bacterium]
MTGRDTRDVLENSPQRDQQMTSSAINRVVRTAAVTFFVLTLGQSASAQRYCARPHLPDIPSGYSANASQMDRAKDEIEDYVRDMRDYLWCIDDERREVERELDGVRDEWRSAVQDFNSQ